MTLRTSGLVAACLWIAAGVLLSLPAGCSRPPQPSVKKIPAGKEFAGFLSDYSKLKPNPRLEGNALTYAQTDAQKSLRRYVAMMVDPVEVYLATDADEAKVEESTRSAVSRYFEAALVKSVSDAYPVVSEKGPLVLRLRAAIVGVDAGSQTAAKAVNVTKVGVEMELVDSETGEQIAAMVDREPLGSGAEVGSAEFTREEKFREAREAFDGWADRVRQFLDAQHELSKEDADRADKSYRPYGQ